MARLNYAVAEAALAKKAGKATAHKQKRQDKPVVPFPVAHPLGENAGLLGDAGGHDIAVQ
jgi:hypothetical protein